MGQRDVADLVAAARAGSADARDELIRAHFREVVAIAASLVNDTTEAEDLAQEAFIRAFKNLDLLVDPTRFAAWLRRIVVGVSIDWLRTFRPALYRGWSDADDVVTISREPSPLDLTLRTEIVERVRAAIDRLPLRYRVPIRLYHLDGLSHDKIAAALDVPVGTVRSLVARARRQLTAFLPEYAPDAPGAPGAPPIDDVFGEQAVMSADRVRFLHVANGTCTTRIIESAGIPGARSIWADPLYEGPVPAGLSDSELVDVRRKFLAGPEPAVVDPVNDLREWRAVIERHEAYDELILWFEHDLFDQLNLIQLLTWIRTRLPRTKPVSLICIGEFPGRPDFKGLGELTPDELASLIETRQRVDDEQYALAARAWEAFRSPSPDALDALRTEGTAETAETAERAGTVAGGALPYLAPALTRLLQEYPWTRDGLSRTERRLLELAEGDGIALSHAFRRMHVGETVYYVTDLSLAGLATQLARTEPPLLTLDLSGPEGGKEAGAAARNGNPLTGAVQLTDAGRSVLSGDLDRIATCGIDRWLGGVHLEGRGPLWRWDDARQRIVSS